MSSFLYAPPHLRKNMTNRNALLACAMIVILGPAYGTAATITFNNANLTQSWSDALNWDLGVLPGDSDFAVLENSQSVRVTNFGTESGYIRVQDNASLTVSNGSLTYGRLNNRWMSIGGTPGAVVQTGGTVQGVGSNSDLYIGTDGVYDISGGTLSVTDDLRVFNGGRLVVSGSSTINVGDDLRLNGSTSIDVSLSGTSPPSIFIADDLRLGGTSTLNIDATGWLGASTVPLFSVSDEVIGSFDFLNVNGLSVDPSLITFSSNQVLVPVTEPSTSMLALIGIGVVAVFWSRRARAIVASQRRRLVPLFTDHQRVDKPLSMFSRRRTRIAFAKLANRLAPRSLRNRADVSHLPEVSERRGRPSKTRQARQIER